MLRVNSYFQIADNTGATSAMCIRVLRKKKEQAFLGDLIITTVKTAKTNRKLKKGEIRTAVIIRQKQWLKRKNGVNIKAKTNAIVFVNKQNNPLGSRVKGPVFQELRKKKMLKILAMAAIII